MTGVLVEVLTRLWWGYSIEIFFRIEQESVSFPANCFSLSKFSCGYTFELMKAKVWDLQYPPAVHETVARFQVAVGYDLTVV